MRGAKRTRRFVSVFVRHHTSDCHVAGRSSDGTRDLGGLQFPGAVQAGLPPRLRQPGPGRERYCRGPVPARGGRLWRGLPPTLRHRRDRGDGGPVHRPPPGRTGAEGRGRPCSPGLDRRASRRYRPEPRGVLRRRDGHPGTSPASSRDARWRRFSACRGSTEASATRLSWATRRCRPIGGSSAVTAGKDSATSRSSCPAVAVATGASSPCSGPARTFASDSTPTILGTDPGEFIRHIQALDADIFAIEEPLQRG